jgi:hypothetical protein
MVRSPFGCGQRQRRRRRRKQQPAAPPPIPIHSGGQSVVAIDHSGFCWTRPKFDSMEQHHYAHISNHVVYSHCPRLNAYTMKRPPSTIVVLFFYEHTKRGLVRTKWRPVIILGFSYESCLHLAYPTRYGKSSYNCETIVGNGYCFFMLIYLGFPMAPHPIAAAAVCFRNWP